MLWYRFFEPHILDRGEAYYQDGCVTSFKFTETGIDAQVEGEYLYHISIELDGGHVKDMSCDCPYARSGENCKHMAAVLFQYEEMLAEEDFSSDSEESDDTDDDDELYASDSDEVAELVSRIPEEECRNILIDYVRQDVSLYHKLQIQYTDKLNKRQKRALKEEIDHIVRNNSYRGYVDWRQADQFVSELTDFLDEKVRQLIQHNELEFAFELTNEVFHCVGTMDMDDSYGGSSDVASQCYEYWRLILERSDETLKNRMKKWFRMHQHGYVLDVYEDYLEEF
ncbi:MAG: SWIM zinc finger family protein [Eubacteriales bacterium]|nr:SWIM zinc finger family protein [Eubacteriales bacterium]